MNTARSSIAQTAIPSRLEGDIVDRWNHSVLSQHDFLAPWAAIDNAFHLSAFSLHGPSLEPLGGSAFQASACAQLQ